MTRTANARVAGVAFLTYIAAGITDMAVSSRTQAGADTAAKLASIAQHAADVQLALLLQLAQVFCALVLGVTLWAITRDEDADLAMLAMICRIIEGVLGALSVPATLSLLWLATTSGSGAPDPTAAQALAAYLMRGGAGVAFTALFFAVGSTLFAWLLLRGRMIPAALAWLGVAASVLLVAWLPLQLAGVLPNAPWIWAPMFFFEVPLALWFLIKGVAQPRAQAVAG